MARLRFSTSGGVGVQGETVAEASATTATTVGDYRADASGILDNAKDTSQPPAQADDSDGPQPAQPESAKRCGWICAFAAVAGFLGGSIIGKRFAGK